MAGIATHIRWKDVLERKNPDVLPFLRFYREVGLVPESSERNRRPRLEPTADKTHP